MALVRWEPLREISSIQSEVNRLFNTFFDTPVTAAERRWIPAMDLVESDEHFVLRADLPGLTQEDVNLELEDNVLTVSGERKAEHEERNEGYHRVERAYGRFSRSLTLPEGIDPEAVEARFDKGVLEVRIPKPEQRKPQRVAINVGSANGEQPKTIEGSETDRASAREAQRES
jgi:HSP20 family protein